MLDSQLLALLSWAAVVALTSLVALAALLAAAAAAVVGWMAVPEVRSQVVSQLAQPPQTQTGFACAMLEACALPRFAPAALLAFALNAAPAMVLAWSPQPLRLPKPVARHSPLPPQM